ncbi:hypothetical protein ACGFYQ_18500 [Streptomyces sp. NPDC048258]|uniref:hypothetical protein n=1 Tax=Streptomyces sp. NPDC048258 TaxID=3365527 RepID=UPI00371656C0
MVEDPRGYHLIRLGEEVVGGLGPSPAGPRFGSSWNVYLAAEDLDRTQAAVTALGGRVLVPAVPASGNGRLCLALDPQGAPFGLWEGSRAESIVLADEPGALSGCALHTPDPGAAAAFYTALVGPAAEDYTYVSSPRARWVPHLGVPDLAEAERQACAAGARLAAPGVLTDPWGAVFGLAEQPV